MAHPVALEEADKSYYAQAKEKFAEAKAWGARQVADFTSGVKHFYADENNCAVTAGLVQSLVVTAIGGGAIYFAPVYGSVFLFVAGVTATVVGVKEAIKCSEGLFASFVTRNHNA